MAYEVGIVEVEETPIAAVAGHITFSDIPAKMMPMMDKVWDFIRANGIEGYDHNVWLYRITDFDELDVEVGVQLSEQFEGKDDVQRSSTPGGRAAHAVHYGEYHELKEVHGAIMDWCEAEGHKLAGVDWEVYGDWHDDAAKRRTDVYYLLEP